MTHFFFREYKGEKAFSIYFNTKCVTTGDTLPVKMFGPFWSVWCKMALAEVGVSLL